MKTWSVVIEALIAIAFLAPSPARAVTIGFAPEVGFGGTPVDVPIVVSGLGDAAPPSLSTFDLDISFANQTLIESFNTEVKFPIVTNVSFLGFGKNRNHYLKRHAHSS